MKYYLKVIKKYAVFDGRAHRAEYWYFILFSFLVSLLIGVIEGFIRMGGLFSLDTAYFLFIFIPSLAVISRRLHDIGRSESMMLIGLVPVIGWIWLIVLLSTRGESGANKYGPSPKAQQTIADRLDGSHSSPEQGKTVADRLGGE